MQHLVAMDLRSPQLDLNHRILALLLALADNPLNTACTVRSLPQPSDAAHHNTYPYESAAQSQQAPTGAARAAEGAAGWGECGQGESQERHIKWTYSDNGELHGVGAYAL